MTSKYITDSEKNYCSCKSWKYQRLPVLQRSCKHLRLQNAPKTNDRMFQKIDDKDLEFIIEISDDLSKAMILDETSLRQIMVNLIWLLHSQEV